MIALKRDVTFAETPVSLATLGSAVLGMLPRLPEEACAELVDAWAQLDQSSSIGKGPHIDAVWIAMGPPEQVVQRLTAGQTQSDDREVVGVRQSPSRHQQRQDRAHAAVGRHAADARMIASRRPGKPSRMDDASVCSGHSHTASGAGPSVRRRGAGEHRRTARGAVKALGRTVDPVLRRRRGGGWRGREVQADAGRPRSVAVSPPARVRKAPGSASSAPCRPVQHPPETPAEPRPGWTLPKRRI